MEKSYCAYSPTYSKDHILSARVQLLSISSSEEWFESKYSVSTEANDFKESREAQLMNLPRGSLPPQSAYLKSLLSIMLTLPKSKLNLSARGTRNCNKYCTHVESLLWLKYNVSYHKLLFNVVRI